MAVVVLLGAVIFTGITVQLLEGGVRTVQASTVVYGDGAKTSAIGNINNPRAGHTPTGSVYTYYFYLSEDGKTRYIQEFAYGQSSKFYKWEPNEKLEFGG